MEYRKQAHAVFYTVGANEDIIRKYIEHQGQLDSGQAKLVL